MKSINPFKSVIQTSYDIIKAHGGEIKAETKEGEGAEFIIQLPIVWTGIYEMNRIYVKMDFWIPIHLKISPEWTLFGQAINPGTTNVHAGEIKVETKESEGWVYCSIATG